MAPCALFLCGEWSISSQVFVTFGAIVGGEEGGSEGRVVLEIDTVEAFAPRAVEAFPGSAFAPHGLQSLPAPLAPAALKIHIINVFGLV